MRHPPWTPTIEGMTDELESALSTARAVRFLCSGNVVRSAFAELLARHLGCRLPVDSAATWFQNPGLFPETRAALLTRGVSAKACAAFRPRHLSRCADEDTSGLVVLGMAPEHLQAWRGQRPGCGDGFLLGRLDPGGGTPRIADPVLDGADFELTFQRIEVCVRRLVELLERGEAP